MQVVYDVLPTGKKIPYLVTDDIDINSDDFDPTIGVPIVFTDINLIAWDALLVKLHNIYMQEEFYTKNDLDTPERIKRFIEVSRSILLSELLQHMME
jgi:hypothetical protein